MSELVVYLLLALPLAWSALVALLRRLMLKSTAPSDAAEKYQLLIILTPILLGGLWLVVSQWMPVHVPLPPLVEATPMPMTVHVVAVKAVQTHTAFALPWALIALAVWAMVASIRLAPLGLAMAKLQRLAAQAARRDVDGVIVRVTPAVMPPIAWGRSTILLPQSLAAQMTAAELALILRHEQAHLDRKDPLYFAVLAMLDALLWFNPFLRAQTQRCRLAAELTCDAAAMGKNPAEREIYARVLIRTLKHTAGDVRQYAPAVISNVKSGDYRMRLKEIMHADPAARKTKRRGIYIVLALALTPVAALQFAWAQTAAPTAAPAAAPAQPGKAEPQYTASTMVAPVDGPISAPFGAERPVNGKIAFHQGVDYPVPVGTPVRAAADGTVSRVGVEWGYGKVVEVDHGNGLKTRLAHLDSQKVAVGDHVTAGQIVATSGHSGNMVSAGPHLHFEVWKDGKPIDPATVVPVKTVEAKTLSLSANRMHWKGSVLTGEGNAILNTGLEVVHADYIEWDQATGHAQFHGNVTIDHADGKTASRGLFEPAAASN